MVILANILSKEVNTMKELLNIISIMLAIQLPLSNMERHILSISIMIVAISTAISAISMAISSIIKTVSDSRELYKKINKQYLLLLE